MAPRGFRESAWGQAEERVFSLRFLLSIAVAVLVVGIIAGYLLRSANDDNPLGTLPTKAVAQSAVIDPTLAAMVSADNTQDGAVKAATSFITGYGDLALKTARERDETLNTLIDPSAAAAVRTALEGALTLSQQQLTGSDVGVTTTAKILTMPASYRVTANGNSTYTVTIWFLTTYLDSNGARLVSGWTTDDLTMRYTDHWRVLNFVSKVGPTPPVYTLDGQSSTYNDVAGILNNAYAYRPALSR